MRAFACTVLVLMGTACFTAPDYRMPVRSIAGDELVRPVTSVVFGHVRDMAADADGVWILDSSPPFLTRIELFELSISARFGQPGDGPGELRQPVAVQAVTEGVRVWDPGANRVMTFAPDGGLLAAEPLSNNRSARVRPDMLEVAYVDPWRVRQFGPVVTYAHFSREVRHITDVASGTLVRTDAALDRGTPVISFGDLVPPDDGTRGQFAPMPAWDVCAENVVVWDARDELVRWLDHEGAHVDSVALSLPRSTIEADDVERYLRHVARHELGPSYESSGIDFTKQASRVRTLFRRPAPTVVDVRCDGDGVAWAQLFDMAHDPLGHGSSWARVSREGTPEIVDLPPVFRPFAFSRDGTVIGVTDHDEGQVLTLWRDGQHTEQ